MCKGCGWVLVWQFLWGRKWSIFLPHKNSTPRYHPMVFTLFMTVFVGQEMVNFPAPQKLDPKISPHGIHTIYDSVCGAGNGQFSCPTKTRLQAPKSSQNRGIFDVYAKPKTTSVAKTPLFATYSTMFLDHLLKNTGIYSVLWKHMHETP